MKDTPKDGAIESIKANVKAITVLEKILVRLPLQPFFVIF
mgnify:CR=1 FL=1